MAATYIVRINPDGAVIPLVRTDLLDVANVEFAGQATVVTLRSPETERLPHTLVGVIHDWGLAAALPLNRKAWALYGRSPIYGAMFVAYDQDEDGGRVELPNSLIAVISDADWPSPMVHHSMNMWLDNNPEFPRDKVTG